MRYAVTAASGRFGRRAVTELLERGVDSSDILAISRDPTKVADLAELGVQVRQGDYTVPDGLDTALAGVERMLLVSGMDFGERAWQHANVVCAATNAGVRRIVYTSFVNAGKSSHPHAHEHATTEALIRGTGVPFTIVRDGWYVENYTSKIATHLEASTIVGCAGDGRVSGACRADYAAAVVAALVQDEEDEKTYTLGGPAFTFADYASAVGRVAGSPITYLDLTPGDYFTWLRDNGVAARDAQGRVQNDAAVAAGDLETDSDDLMQLLGRPPITLAESIREAIDAGPAAAGRSPWAGLPVM